MMMQVQVCITTFVAEPTDWIFVKTNEIASISIPEVRALARRAVAAAPNGHYYTLAARGCKCVTPTVCGLANTFGLQLPHLRRGTA